MLIQAPLDACQGLVAQPCYEACGDLGQIWAQNTIDKIILVSLPFRHWARMKTKPNLQIVAGGRGCHILSIYGAIKFFNFLTPTIHQGKMSLTILATPHK